MFGLRIHDDAKRDLESIALGDEDAASFLLVLLEELSGDQNLLDRLTQHGYHVRDSDDWAANFNVSQWLDQQSCGRNLWRLKSWEIDASGYRIVYAFQPLIHTYVVLGIFHRGTFDYDRSNPLTRRVISAYQDL